MTISTTIIKNSALGNGSVTAFTYSFKITSETEIEVIVKTNATGAESVRSIGTGSTNYSVSGVGNSSGGTVTFVTAPLSTETVVLRRSTAQTQAMDLIDNDPMSADTIETAHDKAIAITQELQEQIDRSLKISRANTMTSTEFVTSATDRANKVLSFDSSGELAVTQELGTVKGNWATSTAYVVRDIIKDTSNNNIYICLTAHTSSGSQPISSNTDSAKWSLLVDAASATTSATNAASSATAAASSATAAASSATAAATSETNAATSASTASTQATNASNSATAAANSETSAAALLDTFDDAFLGSKSSDPSVDNDGDALTDGDLYYNTSDNRMKVYDLGTTTWLYVSPSSSDQTAINTVSTNINSVNTTATNISGVNSFADRYRVGSSDPSTSLDAGDLNFNTSSNDLKYYDGSSWNVIANQDINVKVSANDTSSGVLSSKITATGSTGVSLTETNDGSNETLNVTLASVPNASLSNSAITINGSAVSLGGSVTVGETKPTATGCTPSTITNDATNVVIAGTNFTSIPQVWALNTSTGIWYLANSVSYTSSTSITANFTLSVDASYKIRVENPDGNAALSSTNILTVSDVPTWSTASGSLGTIAGDFSGTVATVAATSDSAITYSEVTTGGNVLTNSSQANCSLNSSTGVITTSDFGGSSTTATLYNFTIRATDAENQTTDRDFSLTSSYGATGGGQFN